MSYHFDEAAGSLSPETSHPRFVALAPESFYSATDEFAPFGSDDGNDVLRDMEAWYEQRDPGVDPEGFLDDLLEGWAFDLPDDVLDFPDDRLLALAADGSAEARLVAVGQACIAAAVGQLKIEGVVSPSMQIRGRAGVRVLRCLYTDTARHPAWPHRADALRGIELVERLLTRARDEP
ncbi:hypothetical protein nbrc107696_37190 [Gordonia spumicola]|uniref:Uncharacterized protein n=1 Tax=Gordonia spumicola TaxID=589161 RepID=A0A7I9VDU6_9ACTN|nr:hypothetical protein [Gordonia spumicola]GEE03273.1 hypothetical protein nbrc107696_37190 [Gordonia spumicola]